MAEKPEKFWRENQAKAQPHTSSLPKSQHTGKDPSGTTDQASKGAAPKFNLDGKKMRDGLAQLVLTIVELLRELMEKQAMRRIDKGVLSDREIENLGNTFKALKKEVHRLTNHFELEEEDLNMSLGPLVLREDEVHKQTSVVEILDRLLGKGVVVKGDVIVSVADVDLLSLNLGLLLASIDKAQELYQNPANTAQLEKEVSALREENERLKNQQARQAT